MKTSHIRTRIQSVLLVIALVLGMLPIMASASDASQLPDSDKELPSSVYTVDFSYGGQAYHMEGGSSFLLSELFQSLGYREHTAAQVTAVTFSNPELIAVERQSQDWLLESLCPFSSDERLDIVFCDGETLSIAVTDISRTRLVAGAATININDNTGNMTIYVYPGVTLTFDRDADYVWTKFSTVSNLAVHTYNNGTSLGANDYSRSSRGKTKTAIQFSSSAPVGSSVKITSARGIGIKYDEYTITVIAAQRPQKLSAVLGSGTAINNKTYSIKTFKANLFDYDENFNAYATSVQGEYGFQFGTSPTHQVGMNNLMHGYVKQGIMASRLSAAGKPVFNSALSGYTADLPGLFSTDSFSGKTVYPNVDMEFVKIGDGNKYSYRSSMNHMEYNSSANRLELYNTTIARNKDSDGTYFMPLNTITDAWVVDGNAAADNDLNTWASNLSSGGGSIAPKRSCSSDMNYMFGLELEVNYYQNKTATDPVTGEDLVYYFSGDDDVWVYIDDYLVLDIGGTHGAKSGSINLKTKKAVVDGPVLQMASWQANPSESDAQYNVEVDLTKLGHITDVGTHTMKIFYLERHLGGSNCEMTFILPTYDQENSVVVLSGDAGIGATYGDGVYNKSNRITVNADVKAHYRFAGWYDKNTNQLVSTDKSYTFTGTEDRYDLEARTRPDPYSVRFDGNGSTAGSMANQQFTYDMPQALTPNAYSRSYAVAYDAAGGTVTPVSSTARSVFVGWAVTADGAKVYDDKQVVQNLSDTYNGITTLYAKWNPGTVTLPTPTRTGYKFDGWYSAQTGGTKIGEGGASYTPQANVTVYAHWKDPYFTVVNSSTGAQTQYPLAESFDITACVSAGYLYGGLFTDAGFSEVYTEDTWVDAHEGSFSGLELEPQAGEVFYLKEVSDAYLRPKTLSFYTGRNDKEDVKYSYLITVIDSVAYYLTAGFDIDDDSWNAEDFSINNDTVYETLTAVTARGSTDLNCGNFAAVSRGYLVCNPIDLEDLGCKESGDALTVRPFYVTTDGIKVSGTVERTLRYQPAGLPIVSDSDPTASKVQYYEASGGILEAPMMKLMASCKLGVSEEEQEDSTCTVTKCYEGQTASQRVEKGDCVGKITYPEVEGKRFAGWYADAAFTVPADFSDVQESMTVYGKYISDDYFRLKLETKSSRKVITKLRPVFAIDSRNYRSVGVEYEIAGTKTKLPVTKYTATLNGKSARKLFGGEVAVGSKLMIADMNAAELPDGAIVRIRSYWQTPDGTVVYGSELVVKCHRSSVELIG